MMQINIKQNYTYPIKSSSSLTSKLLFMAVKDDFQKQPFAYVLQNRCF